LRTLRYTNDAPKSEPHRLFGPIATFYLHRILADANLPDGWVMGQGLSRAHVIASPSALIAAMMA